MALSSRCQVQWWSGSRLPPHSHCLGAEQTAASKHFVQMSVPYLSKLLCRNIRQAYRRMKATTKAIGMSDNASTNGIGGREGVYFPAHPLHRSTQAKHAKANAPKAGRAGLNRVRLSFRSISAISADVRRTHMNSLARLAKRHEKLHSRRAWKWRWLLNPRLRRTPPPRCLRAAFRGA